MIDKEEDHAPSTRDEGNLEIDRGNTCTLSPYVVLNVQESALCHLEFFSKGHDLLFGGKNGREISVYVFESGLDFSE